MSRPNWDRYTSELGWHPFSPSTSASGKIAKSTVVHNEQAGILSVSGIVIGRIEHVHISNCKSTGITKDLASRAALMTQSEEEIWSVLPDLRVCLIMDVWCFSISARETLESQYGKEKALKMIANGEIWKTVNGGIDFKRYTSKFPEIERQSPSYNYWILDSLARECSTFYEVLSEEWAHLTPAFPDSPDHFRWALGVASSIAATLPDHAFFLSDEGHLGRAPCPVQEGDMLCVIFGCSLPAILRLMSDDIYQVVTFLYVSGIMKGEVVEDAERVKRGTQVFRLR
ncbi:hypothetical protein MMC28_011053 [Mycoblastus sanguinarius]|nr:hypothetical protein [Mycoblastus sanguinarius]